MEQYNFEIKNVPILARMEVLVVGSGTAGVAAALSVKNSIDLRDLEVTELQDELKKLGVDSF